MLCEHGNVSPCVECDMEPLRAECEKLRKDMDEESSAVIDKMAKLLAGVAVALKGEEPPLHSHSYHDLPEGVMELRAECKTLVEALEAIQKAATHKNIHTGIQAGTALGCIAAICDITLAAHRKQEPSHD